MAYLACMGMGIMLEASNTQKQSPVKAGQSIHEPVLGKIATKLAFCL